MDGEDKRLHNDLNFAYVTVTLQKKRALYSNIFV